MKNKMRCKIKELWLINLGKVMMPKGGTSNFLTKSNKEIKKNTFKMLVLHRRINFKILMNRLGQTKHWEVWELKQLITICKINNIKCKISKEMNFWGRLRKNNLLKNSWLEIKGKWTCKTKQSNLLPKIPWVIRLKIRKSKIKWGIKKH